jgi:hypothetical protein
LLAIEGAEKVEGDWGKLGFRNSSLKSDFLEWIFEYLWKSRNVKTDDRKKDILTEFGRETFVYSSPISWTYPFLYRRRSGHFSALSSLAGRLISEITRTSTIEKVSISLESVHRTYLSVRKCTKVSVFFFNV